MPGMTSISGVISGLKTDEIIAKLMQLERMPITRLQAKKASLDEKLKAWQDANTRILALKTKSDALAFSVGFMAKSFSSSDETVVRGSTTTGAEAGVYYVTVNALARAHQQKSVGFADTTNTRVGTGTIGITVGSGTATTIDIDDSNNTLAGLRDAINRSGAGVNATIVSDGSATEPYRLVVTSKTSGTAGAVTLDTSNLSGGTALGFTTMQDARDASVTIGEGAGALTVTRATNEITGLIPGVTLNLQSADPTKTVAINIQSDKTAVKQAIKDLIDQYNNLVDFINQQFKYNTATNSGGTLFGDFQLQMIQSDIVGKMFSPVSGLSGSIVVLSQIGITTSTDNKLTINETDLDSALAENLDGVMRLFAASATATDSAVSYVSSTSKTVVSGTEGYAVEVTAAATQAVLTAGEAQTGNLAQDETVTINGTAILLTQNMTPAEVVAKINEQSSLTSVIASRVGDYLTLTHVGYGSARTIVASSSVSSGGTGLGSAQSTLIAGADIAGTINGEAGTGAGQILTGASGNATTDGLQLRITASAPGSYGTVAFTKGLASDLSDYLTFVTAAGTGTVKTAQTNIETTMRDITDYIAVLEERVSRKEDRLVRQFAAMESALSKLQGQGNYLASQIAGFTKSSK
ncbi:MAG: flagellar filament capping protein FliD [Armatimonadota bacterium]|nr:flagellar filament capping protein FliD [Armatimonadota bacterium]